MMFDLMPFEQKSRNLADYFDNLEKSFFGGLSTGVGQIRTDILDKGDKYLLRAELPGFEKSDIKIDLNGDMLTISAEHNQERVDEKDDYVRRERRYGSFTRSFDVTGIQTDKIDASYNNGVLELALPKVTQTQPGSRAIQVR